MLERLILELGRGAYERVITPLKRSSEFDGLVLGFDTEYDSRTSELVSWQLSDGGARDSFETSKLTVARLADELVRTYGAKAGDEIYLVSYFSIAELQFLPVKRDSFAWREYGAGSFDCSFHSDKHSITFHVFDLARFFDRQPLAKVAESFGLKKLAWKRDRVSRADLKRKGFRQYAVNDARLAAQITRALRDQFAEWRVDPIQEKTAASTAAAVFRRGWVLEDVSCDNNSARTAGMRACWGGRAEALARGSFRMVYEYDLASAYPNAAITLRELPEAGSWREVKSVASALSMRGGFAHVDFKWRDDEPYPSLPVVLPESQLYPLRGREWITFDEIRAAVKAGCSVRILEGWGYKRGTTILADYLQEMLERRAKATGAAKVAYKLLSNALIGKFAQRVSDIDIEALRLKAEEEGILIDDIGRMTREELRALGLEAYARVGSVFMPEWNALITGRTRARIGELVRETRAIYVATDAVWTEHKLKKLPSDLTLKRSGPAIVARTRLGMIFDAKEHPHVAHHSIWTRSAAIETLQALAKGDEKRREYSVRRPIKLRESLRRGSAFGKWVEELRYAEAFWDNKRILLPDGKKTKPWPDTLTYEETQRAARKVRSRNARRDPRRSRAR